VTRNYGAGSALAAEWLVSELRPSIDLLYDIEQIINPSRLTNALDQFG